MSSVLALLLLAASPLVRVPDKAGMTVPGPGPVWVFFTDKGIYGEPDLARALALQSARSGTARLERRQRESRAAFDFDDLPVRERYIREVERLGGRRRAVSAWLNAASFYLTPEVARRVYALPFVYDVRPVAAQRELEPVPFPLGRFGRATSRGLDTADAHRFYGPSFDQAQLMGVPELFFRGFFGSGVKLAIFDTGLKLINRAVARMRVTRQHDFISGDNVVAGRAAAGWVPAPSDNLAGFGFAAAPVLFAHDAAADTLVLAFAADSFAYGYAAPRRALFAARSTDNGATWTGAVPLVISLPYDYTYENLAVASRGTVHYLAFDELRALAQAPAAASTYLGWFDGTAWSGSPALIAAARGPVLSVAGDTLYLAAVEADTAIYFRKMLVTTPAPATLVTTVWGAGGPVSGTQLAVLAGGAIVVSATGVGTGRVTTWRSTDGGATFNRTGEAVAQDAADARLAGAGDRLLLFYRDDRDPVFGRLALERSDDGGLTWSAARSIVDSLPGLGGFSVASGPSGEVTLAWEAAGVPGCLTSSDTGTTWSATGLEDTSGFDYLPAIAGSGSRTVVAWLKRGDDNVAWEASDTARFSREQPDHGTRMASLIAGYQQGGVVGIATGVDLLVAKTEMYKARSGRFYEYTMEEDSYVEALEWAEWCGADVVSTSLGYRGWYGPDQFDGRTAPISVAADLAARRGMLVVTAMGNRDTSDYPWPVPYITAPGDAEAVITAGGVEKNLLPWRGTGTGPTSDGRVKPDLVALSDTVAVASPDSEDYLDGSVGTSCATALIAGACALVKEAHPLWSAESVKAALFASAPLAVKSCTFGFGVPRVDTVFRRFPPDPVVPPIPGDGLGPPFPNPFLSGTRSRVYFPINLSRPAFEAVIRIFTASGTLIDTVPLDADAMTRPGRYGHNGDIATIERIGAFWDGRNAADKPVASGLYIAVLQTTFGRGAAKFTIVR